MAGHRGAEGMEGVPVESRERSQRWSESVYETCNSEHNRRVQIWDVESGAFFVLEVHSDNIFSLAFNYESNSIITGSKNNLVAIWRCREGTPSCDRSLDSYERGYKLNETTSFFRRLMP
jgi:WD40 repeat protein